MIVIVMGLPGSGKSFFSERLAKLINAEYVGSDRLRKQRFQERTYATLEKEKVYQAMLEELRLALDQKRNLVMDATFHVRESRKPFVQETRDRNDCFWICIWAREKIIKKRLAKRRPYSEATFEVYQLLQSQWEPLEQPHLTLESTDTNIDAMLQKALIFLDHDPASDT